MFEIMDEIKEEMKRVYLKDELPIVVSYSGGKDSNLVLTLLWETLLTIPVEKRTKTVHVISSDVGVEVPDMEDYLHSALLKIQHHAVKENLPIKIHTVKPDLKNRFFVKVLGRGTLISTPNTKHRWCTFSLKINPIQEKLKELISQSPVLFVESEYQLTLWLGVRVEESARRKATMESLKISEDDNYWARHSDFKEILCFHPIRDVTADELWFYFLEKEKLPFGITMEELTVQYGEGIMECGIKTSSDQGKYCGGSGRQGCWTCGMVSGQDAMLLRHINEGKIKYRALLEWKNLMLAMRNDIRFREIIPRMQFKKKMKEFEKKNSNQLLDIFELDESTKYVNHFETFQRVENTTYTPGGMTLEGRRILLEYLLKIQEDTNYELITEDEIQAILEAWQDTDGIIVKREELQPKEFQYDGPLVFLPNKCVNTAMTKTPNPVFKITIDLNMEEAKLYSFLKKRQHFTQRSFFFFPESNEFKNEKLVWHKVTFVVCSTNILTREQAAEEVYTWLGWAYGHFTEETKKAAIQNLMLSAIGEGLTNKYMRLKESAMPEQVYDLINLDDGQIAFAFM